MKNYITKFLPSQPNLLNLSTQTLLDSLWRKARNNENADLMAFIEELKFKQVEKASKKWLENQLKKYRRVGFFGLPCPKQGLH